METTNHKRQTTNQEQMQRKKVACPQCGNDYIEFRPLKIIDYFFYIFNRRVRRIVCMGCFWEGRVRIGKKQEASSK